MPTDADAVMKELQRKQRDVPAQLAQITHRIELKKDEVDEWLKTVIASDLEESLYRIARSFSPSLEEERKSMKELEESHQLASLFSQSRLGNDGRKVASIEPGDGEGKLVQQIAQTLRMHETFLAIAFAELTKKFNLSPDALLQEILKSPVWGSVRNPILERGIRAFFEDDPLAAIHLLIPEIEAGIRGLAGSIGVTLQKPNRYGGYSLKNLDDLMREDAIIQLLTEDVATHIRIVLTDQRGWNLRNEVCHGLSTAAQLNMAVARRVMVIVLLLSLVRTQDEEASKDK